MVADWLPTKPVNWKLPDASVAAVVES